MQGEKGTKGQEGPAGEQVKFTPARTDVVVYELLPNYIPEEFICRREWERSQKSHPHITVTKDVVIISG